MVKRPLYSADNSSWDVIRAALSLLIFPPPKAVVKRHNMPHAVIQLKGNSKRTSSNILCIELSISGTLSSQALICTDSAASVQTLGTIVQTQMRKGVCAWVDTHSLTHTYQHCSGTSSKHIHCQNMTNWAWTSPYHTNTNHGKGTDWVPIRVD